MPYGVARLLYCLREDSYKWIKLGTYHGRLQGVARVGRPPPLENGEFFFYYMGFLFNTFLELSMWGPFCYFFLDVGAFFSPYGGPFNEIN